MHLFDYSKSKEQYTESCLVELRIEESNRHSLCSEDLRKTSRNVEMTKHCFETSPDPMLFGR